MLMLQRSRKTRYPAGAAIPVYESSAGDRRNNKSVIVWSAEHYEFTRTRIYRIELRRALADLSGSTKGQLQAFSEHPPADKINIPGTILKSSWRVGKVVDRRL
jgi:hypothetical protein